MIEDLRKHTPDQLAGLRLLLNVGLGRADTRRTGFFEIDGAASVYYVLPDCQALFGLSVQI